MNGYETSKNKPSKFKIYKGIETFNSFVIVFSTVVKSHYNN